MLLFTATLNNWMEEQYVNLPGFSHHGPEREVSIPAYPWKETVRDIYFFAKSRSQAAKHLRSFVGVNRPCGLSDGKKCRQLEGKWLERAFAE